MCLVLVTMYSVYSKISYFIILDCINSGKNAAEILDLDNIFLLDLKSFSNIVCRFMCFLLCFYDT